MKEIIIIGPPGSGKGTQIEILANEQDCAIISGGDISRTLSAENTVYKQKIDNGELLDDETILTEVDKEVGLVAADRGIIFDGVPRTLRQAERLNEILSHHNRTLDAVVYIELEEDKIIERLSKRRICSICGKNILPHVEKCACGGRPTQRDDDQPATIIKRVQAFLERTLPLVNYYQNKGILTEIDGDQKVADVAHDIKERLVDVQNR